MTIEQSLRYGAVSGERLAAIEERMGEPLPKDYRTFLLQHNGGVPIPGGFSFYDEGNEEDFTSVVEYFFAVREGRSINIVRGEWEPLEAVWKNYRREVSDEEITVLPIAKDPGGNLVCLRYGDSASGQILFFDHEQEILSPVADSFTAFCAMLKPYESGD